MGSPIGGEEKEVLMFLGLGFVLGGSGDGVVFIIAESGTTPGGQSPIPNFEGRTAAETERLPMVNGLQ